MMILLFGPPGVGKGTQADVLVQKYNLTKFSMGDNLREEVALGTVLGDKLKEHMQYGNLVPDDIIIEIVRNFLLENQNCNILFDGFPRTMNQALRLETLLAQLGLAVDIALEMHLDEQEIVQRILNRRSCPKCGRIYNYLTNPPKSDGVCDDCHTKLTKRIDDTEEVIKKRLKIYEDETKSLLGYYKSLSVFNQINGAGSQEEVSDKITKIIDDYLNKR